MKRFLLMAGGTGGHIFPALAVAKSLQQKGHEVVWLGSDNSMESRLVPQHDLVFEAIAMKGVRGNGVRRKLMLPYMLWSAVRAARAVIRTHKIDVAIGFGGFVSFPGGLAAYAEKIPLVIHEQNAVAGLSNKWLAHLATRVLYAFPKALPGYPNGCVGNPVRAQIAQLPAPEERFAARSGALNILVVGGSLGAQILNETVPVALALLPKGVGIEVVHQSGSDKLEALERAYAQHHISAQCVAFIDDMPEAYAKADVVVCRAGALTIAELAAAGVGALLVPYPHAVDDHQTANARFMVSAEAGLLLPQNQLSPAKLAEILAGLSRETCAQWAKNARDLAMPNSADAVADVAIECVK